MSYEINSPFTEYCQKIDKLALSSGDDSQEWYYNRAYELFETQPDFLGNSLFLDWKTREKLGLNVIASVEGEQGLGKSLFSLYCCFILGKIYGKDFNMRTNLYAFPDELDRAVRLDEFRTTHFLDEQRKKNVGIGSRSTELSLQDFEDQCRYTQKNIFYASPQVRDHSHYFVFTAQPLERIYNEMYCGNCPIETQAECYKTKFDTVCPPEFVMFRGSRVPFYERSGYPKWLIFLLKTKRHFDGREVPRGFVRVPMVSPETVIEYDKIKQENIRRLESQEENSAQAISVEIDLFIGEFSDKMIKLVGGVTQRVFKLKNEETGDPYLKTMLFDTRKYSSVNQKVIEAYLYEYLKSRRKYTVAEIKLMVSMAKEKLDQLVFNKNLEFFKTKAEQNI